MKSRWIEFQGQSIFFCDFTNLTVPELQDEVNATDETICRETENSVLVMSNTQGTSGSPQVIEIFKRSTARTRPYVKKSAALGIGYSGPRKILFDIVIRFSGQKVTLFDDETTAKEWLIS